jgi:hypothetical protein
MAASAALLLAFQIPAAARTLRDDAVEPYSGSKAAAEYLRSHHVENVFARGFATPAVLPYLRTSPFVNTELGPSKGYYPWTTRTNELQDDAHLDSTGADYVLVSLKFEKRSLPFPGFEIAARFPGNILWKGRHIEDDTYVLLRRLPAPAPTEQRRANYLLSVDKGAAQGDGSTGGRPASFRVR